MEIVGVPIGEAVYVVVVAFLIVYLFYVLFNPRKF